MSQADPTISDMKLFCKVYKELRSDPTLSLEDIARSVSASKGTSSKCLNKINAWYGVTLIDLKQGKRGKRFHPDAEHVRDSFREILNMSDDLLKRTRHTITIGATNAILTGLLPNPVRTFLTRHESDDPPLDIQFVETDWDSLARKVHNQDLAFALGPAVPQMPFRNIYMKPLGPQIKAVVVFPPDHKKWGKRKKSLAIKDLASENLLVLPPEEQPTVFNVFPADKHRGGRQIVMNNYTSIMAAVRMGIGVSVMPCWPEALEMYQVRWLPITKCPTFQLAAYLRTDSESSLRKEELEFLDIVEAYVDAKTP